MERYILKKPETRKKDEMYFAGNAAKRVGDKIVISKQVLYAGKKENAYIFTQKDKAQDKIKELEYPSTGKIVTI